MRGAAAPFLVPVLLGALAAWLAGCAKRPQGDWVRLALEAGKEHEARWAPYHWYFPEITHTIKARWSNEGHYAGPVVHVHLRLAAKALTEAGAAQVGTLHLEGWNRGMATLEVEHRDSSGNRVDFPRNPMLATFRSKGLVVVPRVAKGSTVSVRLIQGPFAAINAWELPMDRSVPVLLSRLQVSPAKGIRFGMRAYNGLDGPEETRERRFGPPTLTWTAREVMPLADLPYADPMTARPRFLLTNRNNFHGTPFASWKAVAGEKRKQEFAAGLFEGEAGARELAKSLAEGAGSDTARARRILAWVQDEMTVVDEEKSGLGADAVLERRKGSEAQVASLLETLFTASGLPCEVVLSRFRAQGGLDPEAFNPNAVVTPLVIVAAGGREWVAYPASAAYGLGDYPSGLLGLQALSLKSGALRALPDPVQDQAVLTVSQDVPLDGSPTRRAVVELEGPFAWDLRARWIESLAGDPLEGCRRGLANLGFTASIRACKESRLGERGQPFRLELTLDNTGTWIEAEGARTWTAPDLFTRPAWFYDSARVDPYHLPADQVRRETVTFTAPAGKTLRHEVPCREVRSDFIQVDCRSGGTSQVPTFTRETVIRRGRHAARSLRALHADLAGLDRIRDTRLVAR